MRRVKVSNYVIRRLPRYLRWLDDQTLKGVTRVSSDDLGRQLGLTASQIRQDFSCFGEFGRQGYGYNVSELRRNIAEILGADLGFSAVLIGVGNIGRALMEYFRFTDWGITLKAAFDIDPMLVGTRMNGLPVFSMDELGRYLACHSVDIAVLTVPKDSAVPVSEFLIAHGVSAFWNFTNVELTEPYSDIIVENVHFSDSLLSLSYFIAERQREAEAKAARLRARGS